MVLRKDVIEILSHLIKGVDIASTVQVHEAIQNIFDNFPFMDNESRAYLKKIYLDGFKYGEEIVLKDLFLNEMHTALAELRDRFFGHPKVEEGDIEFLELIIADNQTAIDEILNRSMIPGYDEDFDYHIYHHNYIDGSNDLVESIPPAPEGIDPEMVVILSQEAYGEGSMQRIKKLALNTMKKFAEEEIEKMEGGEDVG
jgi:hypothetical protein